MSDSHIQRTIISRLKNADVLRYRDLKQENIDRDLFNYHLRRLVETGVVDKLPKGSGYRLSVKGQRKVADVLHTSDQTDRLFKINPLLIVVDKRPDGICILNQKRTSQPDYGIIGVPGGTILKSEPLLDGASRKLTQETGLSATFDYVALTRRIMYRDGRLFSDVFFPICVANNWSGKLADTEFGENFWTTLEQAITNENSRITMLIRVLNAIQNGNINSVQGHFYEQVVDD